MTARDSVKARRICFDTHCKQDAMDVCSRADARAQGLKTYFTGKPCKHGHVAKRSVAKGDCRGCWAIAKKKWLMRNPDKSAEYSRRWMNKQVGYHRKWYASNVKKRRFESLQYKKRNPEIRRKHEVTRRARLAGAEGTFTVDDIRRIAKAQGGKCACCGKRRTLTVDHITPLAKGGSNWPVNLQMLCKSCNSRKHARDPIEFMQSMGLLL